MLASAALGSLVGVVAVYAGTMSDASDSEIGISDARSSEDRLAQQAEAKARRASILTKCSFKLHTTIIKVWLWVGGVQLGAALRQLGAMQPIESVFAVSGLMWLLQVGDVWVLASEPYKQRRVILWSSLSRVVSSTEGSPILMDGYTPVAVRSLVARLEVWFVEQAGFDVDTTMVGKMVMMLATKGYTQSRMPGGVSNDELAGWFPKELYRTALKPLVPATRVRSEMVAHRDAKRRRAVEAMKRVSYIGGDAPLGGYHQRGIGRCQGVHQQFDGVGWQICSR